MIGKLTNIQCKNAKYNPDEKGNKLSDGYVLFLHIKDTGKYWRMNYRFLNVQRTLYIGVYPEITLAEAREKRDDTRKMLRENKDPQVEKKLKKLQVRADHDNSFEKVAREWHENNKHAWSPKHSDVTLSRLEANLFKHIGSRPIKDITETELLSVIRMIEKAGKRDLAHRQLQHCGKIFLYAIANGWTTKNITNNLKGALQPVRSKNMAHMTKKRSL